VAKEKIVARGLGDNFFFGHFFRDAGAAITFYKKI